MPVENEKLLKEAAKWAEKIGHREAVGRLFNKGWSTSLAEKVCAGRYTNILRKKHVKSLLKEMGKDGFSLSLKAS